MTIGRLLRANTSIKNGWIRPVEVRKRWLDKDGYVMIHVVNHYLVGTRYVAEHRLVMMEKLGRKLRPGEVVHHDRVRDRRFNDPSNLTLTNHSKHTALHNRERVWSKKARAKLSVANMGNQHLLGHRHSKETREKMRRSHTGVPRRIADR